MLNIKTQTLKYCTITVM